MRASARFGLALLASSLLGASFFGAETGSVRGSVSLAVAGADTASAGPLVAYLAPLGRVEFEIPQEIPTIRQRDAGFDPSFLVVTAGQTIALPNMDDIFHNVFSHSRPNDFDLGLYPKGEARFVTLRFPGFVRLYCSIHESMSADVFVAPTPFWALADADGSFQIDDVPVGRYSLRTWSRRLPSTTRRIQVHADRPEIVQLTVGRPDPPAAAVRPSALPRRRRGPAR